MVVGVLVGYLFPDRPAGEKGFQATDLQVLSTVFLRMIKSLIVPLLFATLVVGIAGHGDDMKRVGKLAFRSILYFEIVTTLALVVGLLAVNIVKPGVGVNLAAATTESGRRAREDEDDVLRRHRAHGAAELLRGGAKNEVLQIVFFAIIFAVALSQVQGPAKTFMLSFCESLSEVMFKFVGIVMKFAPFGIGAAIAVTVGKSGLGVLKNLGVLVLTLYGALIVFVLFVLLPIAIIFKVPIRRFWQATKEPWLIAFTTASSEAALPLALQNMEKLGVPRRIVVLRAAHRLLVQPRRQHALPRARVGVRGAGGGHRHADLGQQILMMLTLMLTSKGVAAVPRASLVILSGALAQFGLPLQGVAVILGVDALMDMARTSINLVGNCLATVVMARWEGSFELSSQDTPVADKLAGMPLTVPAVTTPDGSS